MAGGIVVFWTQCKMVDKEHHEMKKCWHILLRVDDLCAFGVIQS